ncbi:MAG: ATP-binding protein [Dehalococcoidia bacterium]|nr:ATP-binding protein [Dehalococcoidia bacterium]
MPVDAKNPCPCGYHGDPFHDCACSSSAIGRYQRRISGPLLDRIDIHVELPRIDYEKLSDDRLGEPSEVIQQRVEESGTRQRERFAFFVPFPDGKTGILTVALFKGEGEDRWVAPSFLPENQST